MTDPYREPCPPGPCPTPRRCSPWLVFGMCFVAVLAVIGALTVFASPRFASPSGCREEVGVTTSSHGVETTACPPGTRVEFLGNTQGGFAWICRCPEPQR